MNEGRPVAVSFALMAAAGRPYFVAPLVKPL